MPEYLHPGVYIEEVSSGVRPIEGVGTSTVAFLGTTERGPVGESRFITNWKEFRDIYGSFYNTDYKRYLPYSIYAFFNNGGKKCYVVRIAGSGSAAASIALRDTKEQFGQNSIYQRESVLKITAACPGAEAGSEPVDSPGKWGNTIDIDISEATLDPKNRFKLSVKMDGQLLETFDELTMNDDDKDYYVENVINSSSNYIRVDVEDLETQTRGVLIGSEVGGPNTGDGPSVSSGDSFNLTLDGGTATAVTFSSGITDNGTAIADAVQDFVQTDASFSGVTDRESFECHYVDAGNDQGRFVLISGTRGEDSSVAASGGVVVSLGLNTATQINGVNLVGTSTSGSLPSANLSALSTSDLKFKIELDGDGEQDVELNAGSDTADQIADDIEDAVHDLLANDPQNQGAYDSFSCEFDDPTDENLAGVWGSGDDNIYAVGANGTILRSTDGGEEWDEQESGTTADLNAIWGSAENNIYAVGASGTILHFDGSSWTNLNDIGEAIEATLGALSTDLNGVWGSGAGDVYIVGSNGTAIHFNGTSWTDINTDIGTVTEDLNAVWGTSDDNVYIVGDNATAVHYNGTSWTDESAALGSVSANLNAVWGSGAGDIYVIGDSGTVIHYDGATSTWSDLNSNIATNIGVASLTAALNGIWGSANNNLYIAGASGLIINYDGSTWSQEASGTQQNLEALWGAGVEDIYSAGAVGTISYFDGESWALCGHYVLTSGTDSTNRLLYSSVVVTDGDGTVASELKLGTVNGGTEISTSAYLRPPEGTSYHVGDHPASQIQPGSAVSEVTAGSDGDEPGDSDYTKHLIAGDEDSALTQLNDISMIVVPGGSRNVNAQGVNYCEQRTDCFFIADTTEDEVKPTQARNYMQRFPTKNSYGALYFPWMWIADPDPKAVGKNPKILVPPSGFMAGIYARTDGTRGVFKAPAGTSATVGGVTRLLYNATDKDQDILNPYGVNCIRQFPASGIVVWGSRTLSTQSDPEWRYIPVRRYAIYLEWSIYRGIQWAVFEPNDEPLWNSLRSNIRDFMMGEFRKGALQGSKPGDAFYVKCDAELNPQSEIDAGRVNVEVGFAPLKPAEFVIIRISQKSQQSS